MGEIRGEKVVFRKEDVVALHELPSAQAIDPIVLHATRSRTGIVCRVLAALVAVVVLFGGLLVGLVETGFLDRPLNARAVAALNTALGPRYSASVDHTVLRFSSLGGLALKAENARIVDVETGQELATTASVALVFNPLALASGRIAVTRLDLDGARFDTALLPGGDPVDLEAIRISDVPDYLEQAFERLDGMRRLIVGNGMQRVRISDFSIAMRAPGGRPVTLAVPRVDFTRDGNGTMAIKGRFTLDGRAGEIDLTASERDASLAMLDGTVRGVVLDTFLLMRDAAGEPHIGLSSMADIRIHAARKGKGDPSLGLDIALSSGMLYADGIAAEVKPATVRASYSFEKGSIELASKTVGIGQSLFPFTGGLIDLDRVSDRRDKGFAIDLVFRDAVSRPVDTDEAPIRFDAKVSGYYLPASRDLFFEELAVSSEKGAFAGSLATHFGDANPQVSFVMIADRLQSAAVKQFWPYWMAKTARSWVAKNIFGGTVTNGRIEVFLSADREYEPGTQLELDADELKIDFDIEGARMNVAGEIPPIRDTSGRFRLRGARTEIAISGGTAYLPSGRTVALEEGTFILPDGYRKPLMADMDIDVSGDADAVAELVTYRPIRVLPSTGFAPDDFSGTVKADVKAHFGLIAAHHPPPPEWTVDLVLDGVDVNKPIDGRAVAGIDGTLAITPARAELKARGSIDGVAMDIALTEPVDREAGAERQITLSGTLDDAARRRLLPGLADIVRGPMAVRMEQEGDGVSLIEADLGKAVVTLPWIGWTKGAGIAARASFTATTENDLTKVSQFSFSGDGFSIGGDLALRGGVLDSAGFSTVKLSAQDSFRLRLTRDKAGYLAVAEGEAADLRPVLAQIKDSTGDGKPGGKAQALAVRLDLKRALGFNGEGLSNVQLRYESAGRRISALDLSAVTDGNAPVIASLVRRGNGEVIELTSGDAGALARFADIYGHMRGGLLNLRLRETAADDWIGSVDIRRFSLVGEERLRSLVSTPAGEGGKSLNDAVRRDIDVSTVSFQRGFARLRVSGGALSLDGGVLRGQTVGATFQGTVRDANGRIDMTGTFMPAYGLNRLFAELPLIGVILGNGRDRGLIGITFKLTGALHKPQLAINPLSIIAPGVFRGIFEFQ